MQSQNVVFLDKEAAERVLILNCLSPTDPLYRFPEHLHGVLDQTRTPHEYHAVSNVNEYQSLLREKRPFLLLHFGHGTYDKAEESGYLHFGEGRTKVWDLSGTAIPPIVLLGACDTAALAETHNNPSNAFLGLGARAVLATLLPVQADRTVELYARVLANMHDSISGEFGLENWGQIVSKTIILNRYLDIFHAFSDVQRRRNRREPDPMVLLEYPLRWKHSGITNFAEGYKRCSEILEESIRHFDPQCADDFKRFLLRNEVLQHTMFYTHLGSPETIKILREKDGSRYANRATEYWSRREEEMLKNPDTPH
jgi:hypothetical protein